MNTSRKDWSVKLDVASWAYRTTYKTHIGMSLISAQKVLFLSPIQDRF